MQQVHHRGNLDLDENDYFAIIEGKTAELTAVSCRLGASYAGAPESTVAALDRYGRNLGIAFQIADDVLDIWGEERVTGKSLGTDLEKQKLTLPSSTCSRVVEPAAATDIRGLLTDAQADAAAAAPALSRKDRRARLRLAARQAARQAGRRRPRLPGRFRGQVDAAHPGSVRDPARVLTGPCPTPNLSLSRPGPQPRARATRSRSTPPSQPQVHRFLNLKLNLAADPLSCSIVDQRLTSPTPANDWPSPFVQSHGPVIVLHEREIFANSKCRCSPHRGDIVWSRHDTQRQAPDADGPSRA